MSAVALVGCTTDASGPKVGAAQLRDAAAPIGAITRFDLARFTGAWQVQNSGGGAWNLLGFNVTDTDRWSETTTQGAAQAQIETRATGVLRLTYSDGTKRDVWVLWVDPDHRTAALGSPKGDFGFVVTRAGKARSDQMYAARQVLDFNGYKTRAWPE